MDNDYVYFIGGPADLSKKAFPHGRVPSTITVVEQERYVGQLPTAEINYQRHVYEVRRLSGRTFMAIHPEVTD